MYDIKFVRNTYNIKKGIIDKQITDRDFVLDSFNKSISKKPVVFNIETTNICNMKCKMCPRTELMSRELMHMDKKIFNAGLTYLKFSIDSVFDKKQKYYRGSH